ncbi:MAG: glycosyltransferase family 39 protein [Candidatus Eisenbacteria bacterium]
MLSLFFLAFAVRLAASLVAADGFLSTDGVDYRDIAENIAHGNGISVSHFRWFEPQKHLDPPPATSLHADAYRPPLLPILGAGLFYLPVDWTLAARILIALLGAALALAVARIAERMHGPGAGLAAGALAAFEPYSVFYSTRWSTEILCAVTLWWGVAGLLAFSSVPSRRVTVATGLVLAGACLARPNMLVVVPMALAAVAIRGNRANRRSLLLVLGLVIAVVGVWTVRNVSAFGVATPATCFGPYNFWLGMNDRIYEMYAGDLNEQEFADNLRDLYAVDSRQHVLHLARERVTSPAETNAYWKHEGLAYMRKEPGKAASILVHRAAHYFRLAPFDAAAGPRTRLLSTVVVGSLLSLSLIALITVRSSRRLVFLSLVIGSWLVSMPFIFHLRFRFPVVNPMLCILAGVAIMELTRRVQSSRRTRPEEVAPRDQLAE